jgi:hypothetical protein
MGWMLIWLVGVMGLQMADAGNGLIVNGHIRRSFPNGRILLDRRFHEFEPAHTHI